MKLFRAIRALTPADAQAALEAYGREKMLEGMRMAADVAAVKPRRGGGDPYRGRITPGFGGGGTKRPN